jgi:ribosomal protein L11 methyltransferase
MKSLRWRQITLKVPGPYQDLLIGQLAALGFGGFLQEEGELKGFIEEIRWNPDCEERLRYCLQKFGSEFPRLKIRVSSSSIRQQNWNLKWERSIKTLEAAPGIVIQPSWRKLRKQDRGKIILHIDPKMSFGTGHHETTRLCLHLLQEYVRPQMSVLDFGSGTGILAIAAVKLGAGRAIAVDHDEWTIPNIKENLKRNRVSDEVNVILGGVNLIPHRSFDLIVANVDFPTIVKTHTRFVSRLRKGGVLILSGLLTTDLFAVHKLLSHKGLTPLDIVEENEWAAIALVHT